MPGRDDAPAGASTDAAAGAPADAPAIYRWLLWLTPADFRRRYGDDLLITVARKERDLRDAGPVERWRRRLREALAIVRAARTPRRCGAGASPSPGPPADDPPTRKEPVMESLLTDVRHTLRRLRQSPGFAAVAMITLALGIGATTAIYSLVDGILLEPLPYPDADRIVGLWHRAPGLGIPQFEQTDESYANYRQNVRALESVGLYTGGSYNLTGEAAPERVEGGGLTPSALEVLGVEPVIGRWFTEAEGRPGADPVVLLGHGLWQSRFGGDPGVLGRTVRLDGVSRQVVGVMPPGFDFPDDSRLWTPIVLDDEYRDVIFTYRAVARLRPGVSMADAEAELDAVLKRQPENFPEGDVTEEMIASSGLEAFLLTHKEEVVGEVGPVLWILLGTVGFVLLIACANVANLLLVRAEGRQREIAVRSALGAGRGRIFRAFLTESTVLGLLGGALGAGLAWLGIRWLVAAAPEGLPRLDAVGVDASVLGVTALVSVAAGLAFGSFPVLRYLRPQVAGTLRSGGRGSTTGRERHRARNALVVAQVALALVLLVGSGLMIRSFQRLQGVEPGIRPEDRLTAQLTLPQAEYDDGPSVARVGFGLIEALQAIPGVDRVGTINVLPFTGTRQNNGIWLEDVPTPEDGLPFVHPTRMASPGYFEAAGIPLLSGRLLERRDVEQSTGAVVVSRSFGERYFPEEGPLGKRLKMFDEEDWNFTIVGVVGDVRGDGLDQAPRETVYLPMVAGDEYSRTLSVVLRTSVEPLSLASALRETVWSVDPDLPISNVRSMEQLLSGSMARVSFTMTVLAIAALAALLLGAVGIYGVISYVVSQRIREVGVRMALGASRRDVSRMVVRQGLGVVLLGIALGLAGAAALSRLLGSFLFEVGRWDPLTFATVPLVLLGVALAASFVPAHRAARVDPAIALRAER